MSLRKLIGMVLCPVDSPFYHEAPMFRSSSLHSENEFYFDVDDDEATKDSKTFIGCLFSPEDWEGSDRYDDEFAAISGSEDKCSDSSCKGCNP